MSGESSKSSSWERYCASCVSSFEDDDASLCPHCQLPRPAEGWPNTRSSGYLYLGQVIDGRYRLDRFLGAGTSGNVYRARGMRIQRFFAMKIVDTRRYGKPEYQVEMMRRFEREVEAMSRLRNPHVVNIYETLQLPGQTFALIMDYVEGTTLQSMLDRLGRIAVPEAIEIVRQVANGLHEAHCAGIVHRDLKPENIMIEQLPASGFFARILDFGVAHMTERTGDTHGFRGTPLYASPEQCTEDPALDRRSDIYSLGCVFFHCLVGQPPFPFPGALKVMECHVEEVAPSIFDVDPGLILPAMTGELVAQMLAKKASDRPDDMREVIDAIDAMLAGALELAESTIVSEPPEVLDGKTRELRARLVLEVAISEVVAHPMQSVILVSLGRQGNVCALADDRNVIHVLSLGEDGFVESFRGARGRLTALHLDLGRGTVYGADVDGTVLAWSLGVREQKARVVGRLDASIIAICVGPGGDFLYCGTERGHVASIDLRTGKHKLLVKSGPALSSMCYGMHTHHLLAGLWDGGMISLRPGEETQARGYDVLTKPVFAIALSPREGLVALVDGDQIAIFDVQRGKTLPFIDLELPLRSMAFTPDARLLAVGAEGTRLRLWELTHEAFEAEGMNHPG